MKFQDSSFNGLKVTVGTKSVTHAPTHAPKAICPINFFKVGGIIKGLICHVWLILLYTVQPAIPDACTKFQNPRSISS